MKTIITITAVLLIFYGSAMAQSEGEVISTHTLAPAIAFNEIPSVQVSDNKIDMSNFMRHPDSERQFVKISCHAPVTIRVKIFLSSGDMVKAESYPLSGGTNELQLNIDDLPAGVYIVQFYTDEDSVLRRLIK